MDTDDEVRKFGWLLAAIAVFLITGFYSWNELRYLVWGKTVEGEVLSVNRVTEGGRRRREVLAVQYQFQENGGGSRKERTTVALDWEPPASGKINIEYLPGKPGYSRIEGFRQYFSVVVFFASLAWLSLQGFLLWREAREAVGGARPRRR